jgi:hypothetical protein
VNKKYLLFASFYFVFAVANAASTNEFMSEQQYQISEPYMNDSMRQKLNPSGSRRTVVSRSATTSGGTNQAKRVVARSAVAQTQQGGTVARAATTRSVVSRTRSALTRESTGATQTSTVTYSDVRGDITPTQCLSKYSECMDGYCHRPDAKYDRCYCSVKLAQIDATYKPAISALITRIAEIQNGDQTIDQDEINAYWQQIFGSTGENSMQSLDESLDIDWSDTESTVRGQNAFVAGDNYCKQALTGCYYMIDNLKSMYRTTMGQDCQDYETYLKKLKYAAEQVVGDN